MRPPATKPKRAMEIATKAVFVRKDTENILTSASSYIKTLIDAMKITIVSLGIFIITEVYHAIAAQEIDIHNNIPTFEAGI